MAEKNKALSIEEQVFLMRKYIMVIACLLFMMIIFMKVGFEECQL